MSPEVVDHRLGALSHSFHQLFFDYAPRVVRAFRCVDLFFTYAPISAADTDVFIASSKAAHSMSFEVREH